MLAFAIVSQLLVGVLGRAIGPEANLHVGNAYVDPDGTGGRSAVLAGAGPDSLSFPGPVIKGVKGDKFSLNVVDALTDSFMLRTTSIHWHGIHQGHTAWADGVAGVTQCPIIPGDSFLYQFDTKNQTGTHWYHSHHGSQYCDGLRGVMVVYDPEDPHLPLYDVDNEDTIITLADWYQLPSLKILEGNFTLQTPVSTLINGKGRRAGKGAAQGPLSVVSVQPGKRYRFRLASISCNPTFFFSIDGHNMTIIEVEGENVHPHTVDRIQIFAGQRYSIVVEAHQNETVGNYWIRAEPDEGEPGFKNGINSAILRYEGFPDVEPTTKEKHGGVTLAEQDLRPLTPGPDVSGTPDVSKVLKVEFDDGIFRVNGVAYHEPELPVLLQILSKAMPADKLLPKGSVFSLPPNSLIEFIMPGGGIGAPHPMHLHGHTFSVVKSAGSKEVNLKNPVRRDVVAMGKTEFANDTTIIRFRTDNPGPWIMHCHVDWHLHNGLGVVFAEDVADVEDFDPPVPWDALCPKYEEFGPDSK